VYFYAIKQLPVKNLVAILVAVTLAEMMFAMGLRINTRQSGNTPLISRWLILKAFFANYLVIPGITLLVVLLFRSTPQAAVGLLILAAAPAAPYALPFTVIAAIAWLQFKVLAKFGMADIAPMLVLVVSGILTGWLLGHPGRDNQVSLSVITSMRNFSLGIGIAATAFPGSPVLTTILMYSFVAGLSVLGYAFLLRMGSSGTD
jgi:predicted Na+-dependent transporter